MNTVTTDEIKTMMHNIDVSFDRKSHYDTNVMPKGMIYHVGDHKYVTLDDYAQTFEDFEWDNDGAEWACYLYTLAKNNPERIDFYTQAYNIGGMETLETLYNNVTENELQTIVYPIYKH